MRASCLAWMVVGGADTFRLTFTPPECGSCPAYVTSAIEAVKCLNEFGKSMECRADAVLLSTDECNYIEPSIGKDGHSGIAFSSISPSFNVTDMVIIFELQPDNERLPIESGDALESFLMGKVAAEPAASLESVLAEYLRVREHEAAARNETIWTVPKVKGKASFNIDKCLANMRTLFIDSNYACLTLDGSERPIDIAWQKTRVQSRDALRGKFAVPFQLLSQSVVIAPLTNDCVNDYGYHMVGIGYASKGSSGLDAADPSSLFSLFSFMTLLLWHV